MVTPRDSDIDSSDVRMSSFRNIFLLLVTLAVGALVGFSCGSFLDVSEWAAILKDTWIIQGVLIAAIVSLIYKLQSDIAGLVGLTNLQRIQLDDMVTIKSRRLWVLFLAVAVSALLPRIASALMDAEAKNRVLFLATTLQVATALLCIHLPSMWQELRRFTTAMIAEKERKIRQKEELERIARAAKDG